MLECSCGKTWDWDEPADTFKGKDPKEGCSEMVVYDELDDDFSFPDDLIVIMQRCTCGKVLGFSVNQEPQGIRQFIATK